MTAGAPAIAFHPVGTSGKESTSGDIRDTVLIPGLGSTPGGGNRNPLQYSCLGNPMDGGAWEGIIHREAKSQIQLSLHTHTHTHTHKYTHIIKEEES